MKDKLKQMTARQLVEFNDKVKLVWYGVSVPIVIAGLIAYSRNQMLYLALATGMMYLSLFVLLIIRKEISRTVHSWFTDELELEKYRSYFALSVKKSTGLMRTRFQNAYLMADAQYHFCLGNFDQSLKSLEQITLKWPMNKQFLLWKEYYIALNNLHQKKLDTIDSVMMNMQKINHPRTRELLARVKAILLIMQGGETEYFVEQYPQTNIEVISSHYYAGVNYLQGHSIQKAVEEFQQIARKNQALFYVQQARKYIEEQQSTH